MIDLKLIRDDPAKVREALLKRGEDVDFNELLQLDRLRRQKITEVERLKSKRNQVTSEISVLRRDNKPADKLIEEMKVVSSEIKVLDNEVAEIAIKIAFFIDQLPNLPDEDVLPGGKENNEVIRTWGEQPAFNYKILDHVELSEKLGLVDYNRGVKLGGANFWLYKGDGALIEWALLNYFIESHIQDGYEFILPPHILISECGYAAGQFPKFADEVFHISQEESKLGGQFLLPTAETALINLHRDEVLDEIELQKNISLIRPVIARRLVVTGQRNEARCEDISSIRLRCSNLPYQRGLLMRMRSCSLRQRTWCRV